MIDEQQELDDEILSAYLDGELPPTDAEAVRRRLAREPELAARLEAMRAVDEAAVGAFRAADRQPIPARILDLLHAEEDEERERAPEAGNVVPLREPKHARSGRFHLPVAIAASVALAVGLALGALLRDGSTPGAGVFAGRIAGESRLHAAFETAMSAEMVPLDGGRTAEPVLTFRGADGSWCRQVRITAAARQADTLACRRDSAWEIELVSFDNAASPGEYRPASAGSAAVTAAIGRLSGDGPPLGRDEEAELIAGDWKINGVEPE